MQPVDSRLNGSRMMTRMKEVRVDDLIGEKVFSMNMNRDYIDVQLIQLIAPCTERDLERP